MVSTSTSVSGCQFLLKQSASEPTTGRVLLIACYEFGLQPLNLDQPEAVLEHRGFTVNTLDLSVHALAELPAEPSDISLPCRCRCRPPCARFRQHSARLMSPMGGR